MQDGAHFSSSPKSLGVPTSIHHKAKSPSRYGIPVRQSAAGSGVITPIFRAYMLARYEFHALETIPFSSEHNVAQLYEAVPPEATVQHKVAEVIRTTLFVIIYFSGFSLPSLPTSRKSFCSVFPFR